MFVFRGWILCSAYVIDGVEVLFPYSSNSADFTDNLDTILYTQFYTYMKMIVFFHIYEYCFV